MIAAMRQENQITCFKGNALGIDAKETSPCDYKVKTWTIFGRECQPPWGCKVAAGVKATLQPQILQDIG